MDSILKPNQKTHGLSSVLFVFAAALVLVIFSGCAEGPYEAKGNPNAPEVSGNRVVVLDDELADKLRIDQIRTGRTSNQLLTVEAYVRNRTSRDVEIQAQTTYRDINGNALDYGAGTESAWTTLVISSNGTVTYRSQALTRNAETYNVRLRSLPRPRG